MSERKPSLADHIKPDPKRNQAYEVYIRAAQREMGNANAISVAISLEDILDAIGPPDSERRIAFIQYLDACDSGYRAAKRSFARAEAYAAAALKD